ncbi:MAG: zinc ribbon domain-containing protein [Myxococcales bacterium]|nr:zinc ribbon domain-containing protein [Myxococcales bacterium]
MSAVDPASPSAPAPPHDDHAHDHGDEDEDGILLPPPPARAWLIEQLAALVKARGVGPLVGNPLIEPTEEFFPDPWAGGEPSVRRLARRLLRLVGVEDYPVDVSVLDEGTSIAGGTSGVSFEGLRQGTITFAVQAAAMRDPLVVVPAMARAVAEAYRRVHGLPIGNDAPAQRLVDVTAVFLGFGLLTANAALRHSGSGGGWGRRSSRVRTRLGVLDPQSVGFLLAVQLHARGLQGRARREVLRKLMANPAGFVRAAEPVLERLEPPLTEQLGLPPRSQWPPAPDMDALLAPFDDDEGDPEDPEPEERKDEDRGVVGMNAGKPVFRVERSKALRLGKMLALPSVMLAMLASRMNVGIELPIWQAGVAAVGLGALGLAVGRLLPDRRCSEPKCGTELDPEMKVCPRCGGTIMGVIGHPKERLAAEEALGRTTKGAASGEANGGANGETNVEANGEANGEANSGADGEAAREANGEANGEAADPAEPREGARSEPAEATAQIDARS